MSVPSILKDAESDIFSAAGFAGEFFSSSSEVRNGKMFFYFWDMGNLLLADVVFSEDYLWLREGDFGNDFALLGPEELRVGGSLGVSNLLGVFHLLDSLGVLKEELRSVLLSHIPAHDFAISLGENSP